jgi:hypothetical protein
VNSHGSLGLAYKRKLGSFNHKAHLEDSIETMEGVHGANITANCFDAQEFSKTWDLATQNWQWLFPDRSGPEHPQAISKKMPWNWFSTPQSERGCYHTAYLSQRPGDSDNSKDMFSKAKEQF